VDQRLNRNVGWESSEPRPWTQTVVVQHFDQPAIRAGASLGPAIVGAKRVPLRALLRLGGGGKHPTSSGTANTPPRPVAWRLPIGWGPDTAEREVGPAMPPGLLRCPHHTGIPSRVGGRMRGPLTAPRQRAGLPADLRGPAGQHGRRVRAWTGTRRSVQT
jgi:hypothetical protein